MKAFRQIIKSLFILRSINQVELRQAIEKQLNKIELANKFTRAVAVGNPNGLEHAEKSEHERSTEYKGVARQAPAVDGSPGPSRNLGNSAWTDRKRT